MNALKAGRWIHLVGTGKLLVGLGYELEKTGKTGGSRRKFIHATAPLISLHKPHPKEILKA